MQFKTLAASAAIMLAGASMSAADDTTVSWSSLGHTGTGKDVHFVQRFVIKGDKNFKRLAFNVYDRPMKAVNPVDTIREIIPGYFYIASPRLSGSKEDSVVIDIDTKGVLVNLTYRPDGFHRVNYNGTVAPVKFFRQEITDKKNWVHGGIDEMPYGPSIYDLNAARATSWKPGVYDVIPRYKKVTLTGGTSTIAVNPVFVDINPENPEYYKITVRNDSLIIACNPEKRMSALYPFATKVLAVNDGPLPNVEIENWPDMAWRGHHIDIVRNYQKPETLSALLDLFAANHINIMHLHLTDDEAWRLEIPGLPELTDLASRRGYNENHEHDFLYQTYAGSGLPDDMTTSANGFLTRDRFIAFLKEAKQKGITVLPEVESPGHARAAIRAMERRAKDGDPSYRLIHDGDTSRYASAQAYHDCVMNPALPGPYKFMNKVIDEIVAMYDEAGVPLIGFHIGGDEVPPHAWDGSAVAQAFMKEHGLKDQHELHGYFVREMAKALAARNLPMFGWDECIGGKDAAFNAEVAPKMGGINAWHTTSTAAVNAVKNGYPVILSNADKLYHDMSYSHHPMEQGLKWAGVTDEFSPFNAYPAQLCPVNMDSVPGKVIGMQGQLWAETLRNDQQMFRLLIPKVQGLAERAWNNDPTWTEAEFNTIIAEKELPYYTTQAPFTAHMRQPGIKVIDGKVNMNAPYTGGVIRYTTDGTEPTETSPEYTSPFPYTEGADIRARYYRNGQTSVTTRLD